MNLEPPDAVSLWLAPMQDVTTRAFMEVVHRRGGADMYVTEYFRVHPTWHLEPKILLSITDNPTGRPVIAQLIGNDPEHLAAASAALSAYPVHGIDLNLGCPAPRVCGKLCGGALLGRLDLVREIVLRMREVVPGTLTLKTRVGVETHLEWPALLDFFAELPIDGLAIHGRTVRERYQSPVHTEEIAVATRTLPYPVIANGSMVDLESSLAMLAKTGANGLMLGRGAIRNPWVYDQIRDALANGTDGPGFRPTGHDVLAYHMDLIECLDRDETYRGGNDVQRVKKFMSYSLVDLFEDTLWHEARRAKTMPELIGVLEDYLDTPRPVDLTPADESKIFCGVRELVSEGVGK